MDFSELLRIVAERMNGKSVKKDYRVPMDPGERKYWTAFDNPGVADLFRELGGPVKYGRMPSGMDLNRRMILDHPETLNAPPFSAPSL